MGLTYKFCKLLSQAGVKRQKRKNLIMKVIQTKLNYNFLFKNL
jgi:hypothetical protein